MSSDRITPGSSLLETMRALAQGKAQSRSAAASAPSVNATRTDQASSISEHSTAQLRQRLQSLVADTDVDDPAAMDMVREPVLREIILWEFGSDFRQSTHFQPMIERINQAMDLDERFRAQFVDMVQNLKH
ncbi:hypothetical protein ISN76_07610 [Dyella halodurans]|uniref:Uncharacterized protein n=1 Tax=Dyella halodurans TaxID=1920171 RepID=A0ABV9C3X9_9GAMM|nr:hypothetical protein [Dyella halodurans]